MSEDAFSVDFSEAQDFTPLPTGWYEIEVEEAKPAESSTGNPTLQVMLNVTEGPFEGRKLFHNWPLSGKGSGITRGALKVLLGTEDSGSYDINDIIGARANVRVTQRVWAEEKGGDGEVRNNISRYRPPQTDSMAFS